MAAGRSSCVQQAVVVVPLLACCLLGTFLALRLSSLSWQVPSDGLADGGRSLSAPPHRRACAELDANHSSDAAHAEEDAHETHHSAAAGPVVFFLLTYSASALAQQFVRLLPNWLSPPHSVMLYALGVFFAGMADMGRHYEFGEQISAFMRVDPHVIFWVLLPMLLYEDASTMQWHVVRRVMPSALLLAFPGVILNTVLTGVLIKAAFDDWSWGPAMLLGSILSATDPVAVIGALHALNAPAKLSHIISGESLLNDGSAVVLFQIFLDVASGRSEFNIGDALLKLIKMACGGPLLGMGFAIVVHLWLKQTRSFNVEMLLILVCVFGSFFVAEHTAIGVSGVLAVVAFGFFMSAEGQYSLTKGRHEEYHSIIQFLAMLSNEAIFVIAGVVGFGVSSGGGYEAWITGSNSWRDWINLCILFVGVHVTRTIVLAVCYPLLRAWGYHLSLKEAVVCMYGGLRGAVGLALALIVLQDEDMEPHVASRVAFHTNGIVLGTLFINGTTITALYRWLQIESPQHKVDHDRLLEVLLGQIEKTIKEREGLMSKHWFFHTCNMHLVHKLLPSLVNDTENVVKRPFASKFNSAMQEIAEEQGQRDHVRRESICEDEAFHGNVFLPAAFAEAEGVEEEGIESAPARAGTLCSTPSLRNVSSSKRLRRRRRGPEDEEGAQQGMLLETMQSFVNTTRCVYNEMFEQSTLNAAAYRILRRSLDYVEEAVHGETVSYHFYKSSEQYPENLHMKSKQDQMKEAVKLGWIYIQHKMGRPTSRTLFALQRIRSLWQIRSHTSEWWLMQRDTMVVLAYMLSIESDIEELVDFSEIIPQAGRALLESATISPLRGIAKEAREYLEKGIVERGPAILELSRHVLCARLLMAQMCDLVEERMKEGGINESDAKQLRAEVLDPALGVLTQWTPSLNTLRKAGVKSCAKFNPVMDMAVRVANRLVLRPF